ncbi:MAG: hypothetical protein JO170_25460 [Verrucomicrobia bacterium]|jgi:hypothetical protein|nr:hypothetical protein [Verrucomicrobiota bacterium]
MPTLTQPYGLGLAWDAFDSGSRNLQDQFTEQSWPIGQLLWGQLESDDALHDDNEENLTLVDFSSIAASPEAVRLRRSLHVRSEPTATAVPRLKTRMSVLDFPPLKIGALIRPLSADDDLLDEMLDEARD